MNFPSGGKGKIIVLSFKGKIIVLSFKEKKKIHIGVNRLGCERNRRISWIIRCSHLNQACKIAVSRLWHTWPFIEEKARVLWRSFCSPGRRVAVSLVCHWCDDTASFSISIAWYSPHMLVAGRCFRNNETRSSPFAFFVALAGKNAKASSTSRCLVADLRIRCGTFAGNFQSFRVRSFFLAE